MYATTVPTLAEVIAWVLAQVIITVVKQQLKNLLKHPCRAKDFVVTVSQEDYGSRISGARANESEVISSEITVVIQEC